MKKLINTLFLSGCLISLNVYAQPANDNPCNAINLTVAGACNYVQYTTTGATASAGVPAPGCASYNGGDVWFSLVVPANGSITIDTQSGGISDSGMAIYSGTCGSLTLIECDDDDSANGLMSSISRTGLTPGNTIWIRFWEYSNDVSGTFSICASSPTPLTNDNPCTATPLTIGSSCNYVTYSTAGATETTGVPAPGCASFSGGDVWFTIVVPANGSITIDTQTGGISDSGMAIYSGTCGSLTLIECDDDDSANGLMSSITRTGLTPGTTIWIRFWAYGTGTGGTFGLCATSANAANATVQDCLGAQQICDDSPFNGNSGGAGNQDLTFANQGCLSTEHQSSWYYFIATTNGHLEFTINATVDYDFAIWGGPGVGCASLGTPIRCSFAASGGPTGLLDGSGDESEGAGGDKFVNGLPMVAGQSYILLIDNFVSSNTPFDINFDFNGTNNLLNCTPIPLGNQLVDFGGTIGVEFNSINFSFTDEYAETYLIERYVDDNSWEEVATIQRNLNGNGAYNIKDYNFQRGHENIYRLSDISLEGTWREHDRKVVLNNAKDAVNLIKTVNIIGQEVDQSYKGVVIDIYSNGESIKRMNY